MIQSQLGDLAVKKKLKKRQRDEGSGESEDEDSRIDRHAAELQEGGGKGCLPSPNQLLSSSPSHGRMKTFVVVTFTFVPGGLARLVCLPPVHTDLPKPHPLFQVVQPWDSETEPHCLWTERWE